MSQIVISEPDIDAAVAHLRELPYSATASMPVERSRKRFLDTLAATLRANPNAKGALPVAPGVWALVQPFGVDLAVHWSRMSAVRFGCSFARSGPIRPVSKHSPFDQGKAA
jgi:hypothetical protein